MKLKREITVKRIALLLAVLLLLAGCTVKQDPGPAESAHAAETAAPAATQAPATAAPVQEHTASPTAEPISDGSENLGYFSLSPTDGTVEAPMIGLRFPLSGRLAEMQDRLTVDVFVERSSASLYVSLVNSNPTEENPYDVQFLEIDGYVSEQVLDDTVYHYLGKNDVFYYYWLDYAAMFDQYPDYHDYLAGFVAPEEVSAYDTLTEDAARLLKDVEILPLTLPKLPSADELGAIFMAATLLDLDGNEVSLGGLISGNKVTLLNIWGTFCGPCISEMPGLGDLARTYADQGAGIVGLTCDILDGSGNIQSDIVEDARDILETTGVEYPILVLNRELAEATDLQYVPTTYIVDASGHILLGPIVSSMPASEWETLILECLEGIG